MTKILSKRGDKTKYFFSLIRQIPHYLDNVKYPTAHFKHENKGFYVVIVVFRLFKGCHQMRFAIFRPPLPDTSIDDRKLR